MRTAHQRSTCPCPLDGIYRCDALLYRGGFKVCKNEFYQSDQMKVPYWMVTDVLPSMLGRIAMQKLSTLQRLLKTVLRACGIIVTSRST